METLPKDVVAEMALKMSPPDLISFCATSKKQNEILCNSETFWRRKLEKDYPEEFLQFYEKGIPVTDPKGKYIKRFTYISKSLEDYINEFIEVAFGKANFVQYLNQEYRNGLLKSLYKIYDFLKDVDEDDEDAYNDIILMHISDYVPESLEFNEILDNTKEFFMALYTTEAANKTRRIRALKLRGLKK